MAYKVLARKWRPKNFSELIGQNAVQQTLINGLKQNRLYPVLLFTGPRGTGKTSSARILAKTLRCQHQKNLIPCDQCEDCHLIQESRHLDVVEIDGASNNGVDAIRELRDRIGYMPSTGSWKVYIIDEVHMLSNSAFNALLKTLEEPPDHILFIMATTESHKIPQTVLSRSQRLDFHLLPPHLIKNQLENICKKEAISIKEDILWIIAKQARGSLRDGQSLLDQVITFCGENLSREKVTELLGLSDPQILFECLQALLQRDEEKMINTIENLRIKGNEPTLFLQSLIEALHNFIFLKKNPTNKPALVQASQQEIEQMKHEILNINYEELHFLLDILLKGEREMAFCHDSQLILEVLLLRFCAAPRLENIIPLNPLALDKKKIKIKPSFKKLDSKKMPLVENTTSLKEEKINQEIKAEQETLLDPNSDFSSTEKKDKLFKKRFDFLEFLKKKDQTLTTLVENLHLQEKSPQHFYFTVPEKFSYLKNKITEPACHKFLENQLAEFLNTKEKITIEFLYSNIDEPNLREEKKIKEERMFLKQAKENSFVNEVKNIFGGEIKNIIKNSK